MVLDYYRNETEEERLEREGKNLKRQYEQGKNVLDYMRSSGINPTKKQEACVEDMKQKAKDAGAI